MTKKTDGDKIVYGTARGEVLRGGSGNDRIYALGGDDHIFAGAGNDFAEGGAGNDKIHGDDGNDTLLGGAGNDRLDGDDGNDWLDGGAGIDELDGGSGSDVLVYRLADHAGEAMGSRAPFSEFDGGSGCGSDTLQLVFTRAEWLRSDVQADVARALAFIAENTGRDGEANSREFKFSAFNLEFERIEKLIVIVDGLSIDPRDEGVTARADNLTATEDAPSLAVNLLANDAVPDLVRSVSLGTPARGTVTLTQDYSNPAAPVARAVYTPNPSAFQYLAAGERATDSFGYTVTDADGDVSTATVTVVIQGVNDGPAILSGRFAGAVTEDAAPTLAAGGTITFSDADLTDTHAVTVGAARTGVTGTAVPADLPAGGYGQLTARVVETTTDQNPQGSIVWSFSADKAAVQGLAIGQVATQVYTLTLTDRAGASVTRDVTVTLTGTNDAPVVTAVTGAATEDGPRVTLSALANARDVDAGAVLSVVNVQAELPPEVSYDAAMETFTLDPSRDSFQSLAVGQSRTVTVTYEVSDGLATTPGSVTWTVAGTNDAPVAVGDPTVLATSGLPVLIDVLANDSDIDAGTQLSIAPGSLASPNGTAVVRDGKLEFTPDPNFWGNTTVTYRASDGLAESNTVTISVVVTPRVIDLGVIATGFGGFELAGEMDGDLAGFSVSSAGDVNADGIDDLIIGADSNASAGQFGVGAAYVVYGREGGLDNVDLSRVANGEGGVKLTGERGSDRMGSSVSSAGDVNGDGIDDLIIGAIGNDAAGRFNAGAAYVVYGRAGGLSDVDLVDVAAGQGGFKIAGAAAYNGAGISVSSAGDVNRDGIDDLIVGAQRTSDAAGRFEAGAAYVIYGRAGGLDNVDLAQVADGRGGFKIAGEQADNWVGRSVSSAGDVNGDGIDDIIVGAPFNNDPADQVPPGAAYVIYGQVGDRGNVNLAQLAGQDGFTITGERPGDRVGWSVSSAGDVNFDGIDDLIVGATTLDAQGRRSDPGATYVVYGRADGLDDVELAQVAAGHGGVKIAGEPRGNGTWLSVSAAGDVNGDGIDDLLIGAPFSRVAGGGSGETYVVYGREGGLGEVDLAQVANGQGGFKIIGEAGDLAGISVSSAGDMNGDGFADILVGAPLADSADDIGFSGSAYVVYGVTTEIIVDRTVSGTNGGDVLRGGAGNDRITGFEGDDRLAGGAGADTFVFRPLDGRDRITDFDTRRDVIELARSEFADFAAVLAHATQVGDDTVIALNASHSLTLEGVSRSKLAADDFLFA